MRNLDIVDTREKLVTYSATGLLQASGDALLPRIAGEPGGEPER